MNFLGGLLNFVLEKGCFLVKILKTILRTRMLETIDLGSKEIKW